jgi:hypothetical protein
MALNQRWNRPQTLQKKRDCIKINLEHGTSTIFGTWHQLKVLMSLASDKPSSFLASSVGSNRKIPLAVLLPAKVPRHGGRTNGARASDHHPRDERYPVEALAGLTDFRTQLVRGTKLCDILGKDRAERRSWMAPDLTRFRDCFVTASSFFRIQKSYHAEPRNTIKHGCYVDSDGLRIAHCSEDSKDIVIGKPLVSIMIIK